MKESAIEASLRQKVKSKDGLYYKFTSVGNAGVPDRIVIMPGGRVIFIELKDRGGMIGRLQQYQMDRIRERGCEVYVLRGIEDVNKFATEVI